MLKRLIKNEEKRFNKPLYPMSTCPIDSFNELMNNYDVHEFTEHWYDGSPQECYGCTKRGDNYEWCDVCGARKRFQGSYEQLIYNNWIDVNGPGIWGSNQQETNKLVWNIFENEIFRDEEFFDRVFWYQPPDKDYFHIYYCNKDRAHKDYWFIFKRRAPHLD